ncbi:5-formyltetrahydrofolate cyclo-ligase, partial [uncultured Pseudoalteromonas sp.]
MSNTRTEIRQSIRKKRNSLTEEQQKNAAITLKMKFTQHIKSLETPQKARIGIYFSNDGELDTSLLIKDLWQKNHSLYLPIIHPFNGTTLYFQRYEENSPMTVNRYGILEPKLNCSQICPLD